MADLYKNVSVNTDNNPSMYIVTLNDGGSDGGTNRSYYVTPESAANFTQERMESAVQALANSLAEEPGYTLMSVKRVSVTETVL